MFRSSLYFVVFLLLFFPMSYAGAAVTLVSDGWLTNQLQQKQPVGDYALKSELPSVPTNVSQLNNDAGFITNGALTEYMKRAEISAALATKADVSTVTTHIDNKNNPHSVTKTQIGLENVQNVDQTNADNLKSGTVAYDRLPVGKVTNTVAAGDDVRFNTISTNAPAGLPPEGQVYIWFN